MMLWYHTFVRAGLAWAPFMAAGGGGGGNTSVLQFVAASEEGGPSNLVNDRAAQCAFWAKVLPFFSA